MPSDDYLKLLGSHYATQEPNSQGGLLGGMLDSWKQTKAKQELDVEQTRQRAMEFLHTIPDTAENAPIKAKMFLDIMNAKSGKKHWSDQVFGNQSAADDTIGKIWQAVQGRLPEPSQQQQMGSFQVGPNQTGGGSTTQVLTGTLPTPGKVSWPDQGKYTNLTRGDVFEDENGSKFILNQDQKTGKIKREEIGQAKSSYELTEEIKARSRSQAKAAAVSKGYYKEAVAASGLTPEQFDTLDPNFQQIFYQHAYKNTEEKAKVQLEGAKARTGRDISQTKVNEATVPMRKAQTAQAQAKPLENPSDITPGTARTAAELTKDIDDAIKGLDKLLQQFDSMTTRDREALGFKTRSEVLAKRSELLRRKASIRSQVIKPQSRIPAGSPGALPSGGSNDAVRAELERRRAAKSKATP